MTMSISYRKPTVTDGTLIHTLIANCPPLDTNSLYCNLLQCRDFADTSIVASTEQGDIAGFISGYIPPQRPDTLFIWQVALDRRYRGQGIAQQMLTRLFKRHPQLTALETTISPGNDASEALFARFFDAHGMTVDTHILFDKALHFQGQHDSEVLYRGQQAQVD